MRGINRDDFVKSDEEWSKRESVNVNFEKGVFAKSLKEKKRYSNLSPFLFSSFKLLAKNKAIV